MNTTTQSPHKVRRELINDKTANVETVHKPDMEQLGRILEMGGSGVVVRLFLGATETMPVRALSYVMSAARVAATIPSEQLQIVSVNDLGSRLNGKDKDRANQQTRALAGIAGGLLLPGFCPEVTPKTVFAIDRDSEEVDEFRKFAELAFEAEPAIEQKLRQKGDKHGGDHVVYSAAHFMHQDTPLLKLDGVSGVDPLTNPRAIISVGCQQERLFYDARAAMRRAATGVVEALPSVQVFTNHTTPPYFEARGGEQSLDDALINGFDLHKTQDATAHRDLTHFSTIILGESNE